MGLSLQMNRVLSIAEWSCFYDTPLRKGDVILSVNGLQCENLPTSEVAKAIQSTPPNECLRMVAFNETGRKDWV